jgi:hypothetical protein
MGEFLVVRQQQLCCSGADITKKKTFYNYFFLFFYTRVYCPAQHKTPKMSRRIHEIDQLKVAQPRLMMLLIRHRLEPNKRFQAIIAVLTIYVADVCHAQIQGWSDLLAQSNPQRRPLGHWRCLEPAPSKGMKREFSGVPTSGHSRQRHASILY